MSNSSEIDTFNRFMVGTKGGAVVILNPSRDGYTKPDALLLAAWLVTLSGATEGEFIAVLNKLQGFT